MLWQMLAIFKRKLLFHKRDLKETIFEMLVPAILVVIGLSLTSLDFKEDIVARPLTPHAYKWQQRLLVNKYLV